MIKFPCRCGYQFEEPEDMAGASLQCPNCGLLVDVPALGDVGHIAPDGTFTIEEMQERTERGRLHNLYETFTRDTVDQTTGREIDLRQTYDEIQRAHTDEPLKMRADDPRLRPKYDPVTGELVRPMEVKDDRVYEALPYEEGGPAARAAESKAIPYASVRVENGPQRLYDQPLLSGWRLAVEMLMPANVTVMFFVFLAYAAGQLALSWWVSSPMDLLVMFILLAHYETVIEETGPEAKDELPRPLRHFGIGDDLLKPFFRMSFVILLCYVPAVALVIQLARLGLDPVVASFVVVGAVSVFVPAVMLTVVTSGSLVNLRPDRVVGVMVKAGHHYVAAVLVWVAALALHLWTWLGVEVLRVSVPSDSKWMVLNHPLVLYPMIWLAIYLMHYYCWYVGQIYRRSQHTFPWLFQRHIPDPEKKRMKRTVTMTKYGPVRMTSSRPGR